MKMHKQQQVTKRAVTLIIEGSRLETLSKGDEGALDRTVTKVMARRGHADVVTLVAK